MRVKRRLKWEMNEVTQQKEREMDKVEHVEKILNVVVLRLIVNKMEGIKEEGVWIKPKC